MVPPPALALHPGVVQAVAVVVATGTAVGVEVAARIRTTETPSAAEVDRATAGGIEIVIAIGTEISETGIEIATEIVTVTEIETETETGTATETATGTSTEIAIETETGISTDVTGSTDEMMRIDVQSVTTVIARRICGRKMALPAERKSAPSADRPARRPLHPLHPAQHGLTVSLPIRRAQIKLENRRHPPVLAHEILDGILIEQTFLPLEQRRSKNRPLPVVLLHRPPRKCPPLAQLRSLRRPQQQIRRPRQPQPLHRRPPKMTRVAARPRRRCSHRQALKPIAQKLHPILSLGIDETAYPTRGLSRRLRFALRSRRPRPLPVPPPSMGPTILHPLLPHPCLVETWALQNHVPMMDRRPRLLPAGRLPLRLLLDSLARSCPPWVVVDRPGPKLLLACHSPACLRALAPFSNEGFLHRGGRPRAVSNGCGRDITVDHPQLTHPLVLGGSRGKRKIVMLRLLTI